MARVELTRPKNSNQLNRFTDIRQTTRQFDAFALRICSTNGPSYVVSGAKMSAHCGRTETPELFPAQDVLCFKFRLLAGGNTEIHV